MAPVASENVPAAHKVEVVPPEAATNDPVSAAVHTAAPAVSEKLPAVHVKHDVAPLSEYSPALHVVQLK